MMEKISYSVFKTQIANIMDKVNHDQKPIIISRKNGKDAVMISLEDFRSYEETAYLMSSPKNAARLNKSIEEIKKAKFPKIPKM
jgi:antitoxin YefM